MSPPAPRAKRKTPKTHHFDYQNQKFGVDSASLSKTLGVNQLCFHLKRFLPTILHQGPVAGDSPHRFRPNRWARDGRYDDVDPWSVSTWARCGDIGCVFMGLLRVV